MTLSFVIRIWLEESGSRGNALWRGHITRVPSGERRVFADPDRMVLFMLAHLERAGGRLPWPWRLRRWLDRWR